VKIEERRQRLRGDTPALAWDTMHHARAVERPPIGKTHDYLLRDL